MRYKRERFTEEKIKEIEALGSIVCYLFDITEEELRGKSRKRVLVDARKLLSVYAANHIKTNLRYYGSHLAKPIALPAWYLNIDHSTASYQVDQAITLYDTDPSFKAHYDALMTYISENGKLLDLDRVRDNRLAYLTWKDVATNPKHKESIRTELVPDDVLNGIIDMYNRGYGSLFIARKYGTLVSFVNHIAKVKKLNSSVKPDIIEKYKLIAKSDLHTAIDY